MGIRFLCQSCEQKVHVKSFLAGKRGICPHCGARVYIPLENQLPSSKEAQQLAAHAARRNGDHGSTDAGGSMIITAEDADEVPSKSSVPTAAAVPTTESVSAKPPTARAVPDPIDEAPNAIWYVRPPSGGQFGPADADVMRRWIVEGRVSSDSLVWREGWEDWQTAGPLFPSLSGPPTPPSAPATSVPAAPAVSATESASGIPSSAAARIRARRKSSKAIGIAIIAGLALMIVVLVVMLIFVVGK